MAPLDLDVQADLKVFGRRGDRLFQDLTLFIERGFRFTDDSPEFPRRAGNGLDRGHRGRPILGGELWLVAADPEYDESADDDDKDGCRRRQWPKEKSSTAGASIGSEDVPGLRRQRFGR